MRNRFKQILRNTAIFSLLIMLIFQSHGFSRDKLEKIDRLIKGCIKNFLLNGVVLVAEKGEVIYQKAGGTADYTWDIPNEIDTKFYIYSMTKQFTAMLIMQLVEEGEIKLEGKITDYLPYYRKDTGDKITIHQLLTHTHGIPELDYQSLPIINKLSQEEFIRKYLSEDLEFEPGSRFKYGSGYYILAAIIREVTGKPYETVLKEKILQPLDMKNSGYIRYNREIKKCATPYYFVLGTTKTVYSRTPFNGGSGMYSTAADLYKWEQALYTDRLLSKKYRDIMFKEHVPARGGHYGYGWEIRNLTFGDKEKKIISHGGGGCTLIFRAVDEKTLIIILNNQINPQSFQICNEIMNILNGLPYKVPKKQIFQSLHDTARNRGFQAAVKKYYELKNKYSDRYNFDKYQLNFVGVFLLNEKRIPDAIEILKLNVKLFPGWWNAHDSLAEAYGQSGNKKMALEYFEKALELNPQKTEWEKSSYQKELKLIKKLKEK